MSYDARIILAGQAPDVVGSLARGTQAAGMANDVMRQNRLAQVYQQDGPGIMAGEAPALNRLAQIDPMAGLGVQQTRLGMDATRQGMQHNEERLRLAYQQAGMKAQQFAMQMDEAQRAQARQTFEQGAHMLAAAQTPEQFAQIAQMPGVAETVEQFVGPGMLSFENRGVIAAAAMGAAEALKVTGGPAGADETFGLSPLHGFDADGNPVVMQLGNRGSVNAVEFPEGVTPSPGGTQRVDTGTEFLLLDRDGRLIDRIPKDVIGTPGSGEQVVRGEDGLRTIELPGGAAERARLEGARERDQAGRTGSTTAAIAVREIDDMLSVLGFDPQTGSRTGESQVAGPRGRAFAQGAGAIGRTAIAGTTTGDFMNNVASLQDTIAINRLLEIKASGAGLGAIPQAQLEALARALGNLSVSTSDEMLARNLSDVRRLYSDIIQRSMRDVQDPTFRGMLENVAGGGAQQPAPAAQSGRGESPPAQPATSAPPANLEPQDAELWPYFTEEERRAVIDAYRSRR